MRPRLPFDQLIQRRIKSLSLLFVLAYCALGLRLFYLQVIKHSQYPRDPITIRLLARRGAIYDCKGKKLAVSVDAYNIFVDPSMVRDKAGTAEKLAPLVGWNREKLLVALQQPRRFTYLQRRADAGVWEKVKALKNPAIGVEATMKRVYPGGKLAAHILGFVNSEGVGMEGIERSCDRYLRGRDGFMETEIDARREINPIQKKKRVEPLNGRDVWLTIDSTIQHCVESALAKSYRAHSALGASAVVVDPATGEILALANMPTFDPNNVGESSSASRRNRAVTDLYEPGSTLKTITACAALEEKVITRNTTFYCRGSMRIGRRIVHCSLHAPFLGGHGACNAAKTLRYSCNMAAAQIGLKLGKEKLHKYESAFGLYERPGSGLPSEAFGLLDRWQDWPNVRVANIAFGQGIAVSPMQLAKAYCAVANGGLMMHPFIVKQVVGLDGKTEVTFSPRALRRVISKETAYDVGQMLCGVVSGGTGKTARVEGYRVAGKTGSAQKALTNGRGFAAGRFVASFVGFLPVAEPKVVILVSVDEPKGTHWGATVAAPVFQQVAREAMWRMKVRPDNLPNPPPPVANDAGEAADNGHRDRQPARPRMGG